MLTLTLLGASMRIFGWGNPSWSLVFAPLWLPVVLFLTGASGWLIVVAVCKMIPEEK